MKFNLILALALLTSSFAAAAADLNAARILRCQVTDQGVLEQVDLLADASQSYYIYDGSTLASATVAKDSSGKITVSWKIGSAESHSLSIAADEKSARESLSENGEVQSTINYTSCQE